MKKIVMVIVAVALIAAGVFGTLAVQRTFEPSISLSSTSIQEQLSDCSEVRAGVDLAQARVEVSGNAITVSLPAPQLLGIEIDPNSLEFYDSSFALFNWENKQDTAEALKVAQQDAEGKVNQANMLEQAKAQAHTLVENLLKPFTVGDNAYTVTVVDQ